MDGGRLVGSDRVVRESAFGWAKGPGGQGEGSEAQGRDQVAGAATGGQVRGGGAEHVDHDAGVGPFLQSRQPGGGNNQPGEDLRGAEGRRPQRMIEPVQVYARIPAQYPQLVRVAARSSARALTRSGSAVRPAVACSTLASASVTRRADRYRRRLDATCREAHKWAWPSRRPSSSTVAARSRS